MIIAQPAPLVVLIEWIKKQKEDLRYQGFGGGKSGAPQAIENYYKTKAASSDMQFFIKSECNYDSIFPS